MLDFLVHSSSSEGNFYTLKDGKSTLAIECGIRFKEIQKALNFQVSTLDGCLVTHSHGDHCKAWTELSTSGINCYASRETWAQLVPRAVKPFSPHRLHELTPGQCQHIGPWLVTPFDTVHDCEGSLGFVIDSQSGQRLLFMSDSAYSKFIFPGLTHIAIEANHSMEIMKQNAIEGKVDRSRFSRTAFTHMSLERLIPLLKANDLSKVVRIWLLHLSDANSDEVEFKRAVEAATGIPVTVAAKVVA